MTQNQLSYWNLKETERANRARERETNRANLAKEGLSEREIAAKERANEINFNLGDRNVLELQRANLAKEKENNRSNLSNEEIKRIDNAIKLIDAITATRNAAVNETNATTRQGELALGYNNLSELRRHSLINEAISSRDLQERTRSNKAQEDLKRFSQATTAATNITSGNLRDLELSESQRHNLVQEQEVKRNNLYNQQIELQKLLQQINRDKWSAQNQLINNMTPRISLRVGNGGN